MRWNSSTRDFSNLSLSRRIGTPVAIAAACCVVFFIAFPADFNVPNVFDRDTRCCISNNGISRRLLWNTTDLCLGHSCNCASHSPSILRKATDLILNTSLLPWSFPTDTASFISNNRASKTEGCSTNPIIPWHIPRQTGSSASVKSQSKMKWTGYGVIIFWTSLWKSYLFWV